MNLSECRTQIDDIDRRIVELLEMRAAISAEVGDIKARAGLPVVDWERESEVLRSVTAACSGIMEPEAVGRIYRRILRESRQIQFDVANSAERNAGVR